MIFRGCGLGLLQPTNGPVHGPPVLLLLARGRKSEQRPNSRGGDLQIARLQRRPRSPAFEPAISGLTVPGKARPSIGSAIAWILLSGQPKQNIAHRVNAPGKAFVLERPFVVALQERRDFL